MVAYFKQKRYCKDVIKSGGQGGIMTWDWSSPVALGLFLLMAGLAVVLLAVAIAVVSGKAKVADIPAVGFWRR